MSDKDLLETIKTNQISILQQQEVLKDMYNTLNHNVTNMSRQINIFQQSLNAKNSLNTQELLTCGQNDMLFAINNLTDEFNSETRKTDGRINKLSKEMEILTQLFIHGEDIKTYDLSTTFPDAYAKIIELEKQRAKNCDYSRIQSSSPSSSEEEELEEELIPLVDLKSKKDL